MNTCPKCGCEINETADCCLGCLPAVISLLSAIEGSYEGMSHSDLVLTCNMLARGRETWKNEAQDLRERLERGGCVFAEPGRGDCEHFVGLPVFFNTNTTDTYGKPNGWCWPCWWSYRTHKAESASLHGYPDRVSQQYGMKCPECNGIGKIQFSGGVGEELRDCPLCGTLGKY